MKILCVSLKQNWTQLNQFQTPKTLRDPKEETIEAYRCDPKQILHNEKLNRMGPH
jgi:hypothetical protein